MTTLNANDARAVAKLASLSLTDEEAEHYARTLSIVFSYFDLLKEVETDSVPEYSASFGRELVARLDEPRLADAQERDMIVNGFSAVSGRLLSVPAVFGKIEDKEEEI